MREVMSGHKMESETGHSFDLEPSLLSQVRAGYEIESEIRMWKKKWPANLAFDLVTRTELVNVGPISLLVL